MDIQWYDQDYFHTRLTGCSFFLEYYITSFFTLTCIYENYRTFTAHEKFVGRLIHDTSEVSVLSTKGWTLLLFSVELTIISNHMVYPSYNCSYYHLRHSTPSSIVGTSIQQLIIHQTGRMLNTRCSHPSPCVPSSSRSREYPTEVTVQWSSTVNLK